MLLDILVPKSDSAIDREVAPRSAIVAAQAVTIPGIRVAYYEGNLLGASNMVEFYQRLVSAAGRLEQRYPTSAMMGVDPDEVEIVAVFDTDLQAVTEVFDEVALVAWAGEETAAICGVRLDDGIADYEGAMSVVTNGKQLGGPKGTKISYRSRAGQVIEFDFATKRAKVSTPPSLSQGQSAPAP